MRINLRIVIILLSCLLFIPFFVWRQSVRAQEHFGSFDEIQTETIDGVIVPQDKARDFYGSSSVTAYFTPSRDDVLAAESQLQEYLEEKTPQSLGFPFVPDLGQDLANYKRQYVGIILNGKKKIWLNFFCNALNANWRQMPYSVLGGGGCYFNLLYDIESGAFSDLWVNGLTTRLKEHPKPPVKK